MLQSTETGRSRWNTEPIEYEIVIEAADQGALIVVWCYPDRRRQHEMGNVVFSFQGEPQSIARMFWRALRRLESDAAFLAQWRHRFPHHDVQRLGELVPRAQR
jgi:hypothetical protein